jgi:quinoprotein glucose dehydrogenase
LDLKAGKILWESKLGTTEELAPLGIAAPWGTPSLGGPAATAGGVVFIGAAMDRYLRAFDSVTGKELWAGRLPSSAQATPMVYEWQGRQFVVVAAGGHADVPVSKADSFVAFALPGPGESGPSLWSRTIDQPGGRFWATTMLAAGFMLSIVVWWRWAKFRLW